MLWKPEYQSRFGLFRCFFPGGPSRLLPCLFQLPQRDRNAASDVQPEADVAKVYLNQECRVSPEAYTEKSSQGFVAEMAPEANRQKGTLEVKVQIRTPDKFLTPELTAKVEFLQR